MKYPGGLYLNPKLNNTSRKPLADAFVPRYTVIPRNIADRCDTATFWMRMSAENNMLQSATLDDVLTSRVYALLKSFKSALQIRS